MSFEEWQQIPVELRDTPQWVCWRLEERNGKNTKIPINPRNCEMASSTNPRNWGTFQQACRTAKGNDLDGVGFVFTKDDPYVGIDMDGFIDNDLVEWFGSYAELSQSGKGCHIIVKGDIPESRRSGKYEVYKAERYFVMTGRKLNDNPIIDASDKLKEFMEREFQPQQKAKAEVSTRRVEVKVGGHGYDPIKLLEDIKGQEFLMLWSGDTSLHNNDHSAADLALVNHLYWACGGDVNWVDDLFRQSGLMRPKWEREDYRNWTLSKAAESGEVYTPPSEVDLSALMPPTMIVERSKMELKEDKPVFDVMELLHGTVIGELVPIFNSVTNPPLPVELVLPKILCLLGTALSGMVDDPPEGLAGADLAKVRIGGEGLGIPPSFYCVTVAESATGKDVGNVLERIAPKGILVGCGSAEGIQDLLSESGDAARRNPLVLMNEMRDFLNPRHWKSAAAEFLTSVYSKLCFAIPMSSRAKNSQPRESRYCAVSLLGNVQPAIFAKAGSELDDLGMVGRCLFFVHADERLHHPDRSYHVDMGIRTRCHTLFQNLSDIKGVFGYDETRIVEMKEFYKSKGKSTPRHRRYMDEYAPKLAFLLGISPTGDLTHGKTIPKANIDKAVLILEHFYKQAQKLVEKLQMDSGELARMDKLDRLEKFLKRHPEGVHMGKICNNFRGWERKAIIDYLSALESQDRLRRALGKHGGEVFMVNV